MNDEPVPQYLYKQSTLLKPTYGYVGPNPERPTLKEVLIEWVHAVNFFRDSTRLVPAAYAFFHFLTFCVFVYFLVRYFSITAVVSVTLIGCFVGTIYNTVWYHRYCSHQAYRFRNVWFARLFLWTNPIGLREESYVIPHRIHHSKSDEPGDPYGPHLGWLGSYLATETQQKTNINITADEYDRLAKSFSHIGFANNSYAQYQRTGSVENVWHYAARTVFATLLWSALAYAVAGWPGALAWISGVFLFSFVVRDFNFRGHSSLAGSDKHGMPANQAIYGIIAGEWHENHHDYPRLARSGLAWWQVDVPYYFIILMKWTGVVTHYNSTVPKPSTAPVTTQTA